MPSIPAASNPLNTPRFSASAMRRTALVEIVGSASTAPRSKSVSSLRETVKSSAARRAGGRGAAGPRRHRGDDSSRRTRPRLVAEYSNREGRRSRRACGRPSAGTRCSLASSSSMAQARSVIGARCAKKVVHRAAPLRPPMPSEPGARRARRRLFAAPSPAAASADSPCSTMSPGWNSTPRRSPATSASAAAGTRGPSRSA